MSRPARLDRLCAEAVELARSAAEETGEGVGEYLHAEAEADRVVTHFFDSTLAGYRGWRWAVVVARAPRSRTVTVNETALLPGPDALKSPEWVPWAERLQAGDVGVGDLLPTDESDTRLMPAYALSDDDAVEDIAYELGVGRTRVMSREGRIDCAERWYEGEHGPTAEIATSAPPEARCGSCGFYLPLAGSLRQLFGVCGNMYASDDASVVSADHGCGAHSEVLTQIDTSAPGDVELTDTAYDDALIEQIDTGDEDEDAEPAPAEAEAPAETAPPVEDTPETAAETVPDEEPIEAAVEVAAPESAQPASVEDTPETAAETVPDEEPIEAAVATAPAEEPAELAVEPTLVEEPAEPQPTEAEPTEVEVAVVEPAEPEPQAVTVEVEPAEAAVEVDVTIPPAQAPEVTVVAEPPAEPGDTPKTESVGTESAESPATEDEVAPEPESDQVSPAADASGSDREAP